MPTLVEIDREATNRDKLTNAPFSTTPPTLNTGGVSGVGIGEGKAKYYLNIAGTGSAALAPILIPKPFRFLRLEAVVLTTSTGVPDATGTTLLFKRLVSNSSKGGGANLQTIFSTNGSQAVDSVVFVGGEGFEMDSGTYVISETSANTSTLFGTLFIEYL